MLALVMTDATDGVGDEARPPAAQFPRALAPSRRGTSVAVSGMRGMATVDTLSLYAMPCWAMSNRRLAATAKGACGVHQHADICGLPIEVFHGEAIARGGWANMTRIT